VLDRREIARQRLPTTAPPFAEAPGQYRHGAVSAHALDGRRQVLAFGQRSAAAERQNLEPFAGRQLTSGDEDQRLAVLPAGDQGYVLEGRGERPPRGFEPAGPQGVEVVIAAHLGQQQPADRPPDAELARRRGEAGRGAVQKRGLREAAVTVDVGIDQEGAGERPGADLILRCGHGPSGCAGRDLIQSGSGRLDRHQGVPSGGSPRVP
jgi:hypothetical protein